MKQIAIFIMALILAGCTTPKNTQYLELDIEQNAQILPDTNLKKDNSIDDLVKQYFNVWDKEFEDINDAMWAINLYFKNPSKYRGESRLARNEAWFEAQRINSNFKEYKSLNKPAIMLRDSAVRNLPTKQRLFLPLADGEGYPFDYLQDSNLEAYHPVKVSHYSADFAWAFVMSDSFSGFVWADDIKILDQNMIQKYKNAKYAIFIKDGIEIKDSNNKFKFYSRVGGLVPYISSDESSYTTIDGLKISKDIAKNALELNSQNAKSIINEMLGVNYGWGGIDGLRDCSAFTKDYFATFGIWIPRNSKPQGEIGRVIELKNMDNKTKKSLIKKLGVPYATLLYMPGHIMLYTGIVDDKLSAVHAAWGLKTKDNGRALIGKTAITSLEIGKDRSDIESNDLLLNRIQSINILTLSVANAIQKGYGVSVKNGIIEFENGNKMSLNNTENKNTLNSPSVAEMFGLEYPFWSPINKSKCKSNLKIDDNHTDGLGSNLICGLSDGGRLRNEQFFGNIYGNTKEEIEKNLVDVIWLKSSLGLKIKFNSKNGAASALQKVSDELDILSRNDPNMMKYLTDIGGTYKYRYIAGTERLSAHSWAIAIDINVDRSDYWRWSKDKEYKNQIPAKIVEIFEKHGFIWGGRWVHFDTMHFEYRPEFAIYYGLKKDR